MVPKINTFIVISYIYLFLYIAHLPKNYANINYQKMFVRPINRGINSIFTVNTPILSLSCNKICKENVI